jgi:hypothetical protein
MDDLSPKLDMLARQLEALEARVQLLEHPAAAAAPAAAPIPQAALHQLPSLRTTTDTVGVFSLLGRALLGIAGAYLLRAVAESDPQAMNLAAPLSVAYAFAWLVVAARIRAATWLAPTIYATTSAVILAPLLWELTLRFHLLPAAITAAILAVYAAVALLPLVSLNQPAIAWVAGGAGAALALALLASTHAVLPFTCALLVLVALAEFAALQGTVTGLRTLAAMAADLACWIGLYVYASPVATHPEYPPLAAAVLMALPAALFLLYAAPVLYLAFFRRQPISGLLAVQTPMALLLACSALLCFGSPAAIAVFGIASIGLATGGFVAALTCFAAEPQQRNRRIFTAWSTLLLLAGAQLAISQLGAALLLALVAMVATAIDTRLKQAALTISAAFWIVAAAFLGGIFPFLFATLAGTLPVAAGWRLWTLGLALIACPALLRPARTTGRLIMSARAVCASVGALTAAALLVHMLVAVAPALSMLELALLRTLALCLVSVALAFAGARSNRHELTGTAYGILVMVAVKLVAEDLRQGKLLPSAASIVVFALALIATPRLARSRMHT